MVKVFVGSDSWLGSILPAYVEVCSRLEDADVVLVSATNRLEIDSIHCSDKRVISDQGLDFAEQSLSPLIPSFTANAKRFLNEALSVPRLRSIESPPQLKELVPARVPISVIVPVLVRQSDGRRAALDLFLRSLQEQVSQPQEVVLQEGVTKETFYKGRLLSAGVKRAACSLIVLADADLVLHPDTIARLYCSFGPTVNTIKPRSRLVKMTVEDTAKLNLREPGIWEQAHQANIRGKTHNNYPGGLIGIRKEWYEVLGGVGPDFINWGYEDDDFLYKVSLWEHTMVTVHLQPVYHVFHVEASHDSCPVNQKLAERRKRECPSTILREDRAGYVAS